MTEADICAAYLATCPPDWTAYPETAGWDILLVHKEGVQVGIEAKRVLNAKVLAQALGESLDGAAGTGPDFRAVLVPRASAEMAKIACTLGIAVVTVAPNRRTRKLSRAQYSPCGTLVSEPALPKVGLAPTRTRHAWVDHWPENRCPLPEYVPDVAAGTAAPVKLTEWKIKAAKIVVTAEKTGYITARDFKTLGLSMSTWSRRGWIVKADQRGVWAKGPQWPGDRFRAQHNSAFAKIEGDWKRWSRRLLEVHQARNAQAA